MTVNEVTRLDVSILTHLVGWVQPAPPAALCGYEPDPEVSILTHLVGWVQPATRRIHRRRPSAHCFNPHPPGRVGATPIENINGMVEVCKATYKFQSSPTWSGGCNI